MLVDTKRGKLVGRQMLIDPKADLLRVFDFLADWAEKELCSANQSNPLTVGVDRKKGKPY